MKPKPAKSHPRFGEVCRKRNIKTYQDVNAALDGCYYDKSKADKAIRFLGLLKHSKGEFAGRPFVLLPWQVDVISNLFGWMREDGTRRYRQAYIEIAKKNGKSSLMSAVALLLLIGDGEPGAEVYSAGSDRDQAGIVFREAAAMVRSSGLLEICQIYNSTKTITYNESRYHVISADAFRAEGLNIHGLIFDELHAQRSRELFDALVYGGAARRQPLLISITTAGVDKNTICFEEHELASKVIRGAVDNWQYYGCIYAADKNDDWTKPATWKKANPSYGVTIQEADMMEQCTNAQQAPEKQNTFRRYRLNQWLSQECRYIDLDLWDKNKADFDLTTLERRPCYCGLDLSSTTDLTAFVKVFPSQADEEGFVVIPHFWIPESKMVDKIKDDHVPYNIWCEQGFVTATPGDVIDYDFVLAKIFEDSEKYDIQEVAFDRWGSEGITSKLENEGLTVVRFGQGFGSMDSPTKELMRLLLSGKINHLGNPVLRWMADNLVVRTDPAGNVKPDKSKCREKIDGIVAMIMAIDRAMRQTADESPGVFVF